MKVNVLYVVSFSNNSEATTVTVGLFHKHAPKSDSALGVYAKCENDDQASATLYRINGLRKGDPPWADKIPTSANTTRNFNKAVKDAPETDFTATSVPEKRASVGMYLVSHGHLPIDAGGQGVQMVKSVEPLIEANGPNNLKVVCLVRCNAVPEESNALHEKKLPSKADVSQTIVENMLLQFKEVGCRPLVTGWATPITAELPPTKAESDEEADDNAPVAPHGAKLIFSHRTQPIPNLSQTPRRPTPEERELYKFGYYLNPDNKIIALPAGQIQSYYLSL